jgi:hypothetical protein
MSLSALLILFVILLIWTSGIGLTTTTTTIFPVYAQLAVAAPPSNGPGVKITSPTTGSNITVGGQEQLQISGMSTDDAVADCQVSVIVNNVKPYQPVVANSTSGINDYSAWKFLLNSSYASIKEGPNNKITSKIVCPPNNLTKWYSVNVTGVVVAPPPLPPLQPPQPLSSSGVPITPSQKLVQGSANTTTTSTTNTLFNASMLNITSHTSGQEVPIGSTITISGTSIDDFFKNCEVYAKKDNLPFQNVTAAGLTGSRDYSVWKFTYTDEYSTITPGNTNNLTAKISCNEEEEEKSSSYSSSSNSNNSSGTTATTAYANVNLIGINQPPTAVAQTDKQEVKEGEEVILTGDDSSDPNGDSLTYLWKQTTGFLDNSVEIVNPSDAVAQFKVPDDLIKDTTFTFELAVKDSYGETSIDTISIDAIGNSKPVADAGGDIKAERGEEVILDGTGSYDPDPTGEIISYIWKGSGDSGRNDNNNNNNGGSASDGSIYLQTSSNQPVARFAIPFVQEDTIFEFTLTVTDDEGAEDESKMKVEVKGNSKPVADAGSNKKAVIGEQVSLDGTDSHDLDPTGEIVAYNWEQTGGSSSPSVNLNSANAATPSFTIPNMEEDTIFEFTLTVTDNEGAEAEDKVEVEVEVKPLPSLPPSTTSEQQQPELPPPVEQKEEEEEEHVEEISEEPPLTMTKPIQKLTQQDSLEEDWSQDKEDDDVEEQEKETPPEPEDDGDDYYEKDNQDAQEPVPEPESSSMESVRVLEELPIQQQQMESRSNGEEEEEENDDDREPDGIQVIDDYNNHDDDNEKEEEEQEGRNTEVVAAINENDDEEKGEEDKAGVNDNIEEGVDDEEGEIDKESITRNNNTKEKDEEEDLDELFIDHAYPSIGRNNDIGTNVEELIDGIMGKVKQNLNSILLSFKLPSLFQN